MGCEFDYPGPLPPRLLVLGLGLGGQTHVSPHVGCPYGAHKPHIAAHPGPLWDLGGHVGWDMDSRQNLHIPNKI